MGFKLQFYVVCGSCDHRNRPNLNTNKAIELVLTGEFSNCRKCGSRLVIDMKTASPKVRRMREELIAAGKRVLY